jgi:hypothetical protein
MILCHELGHAYYYDVNNITVSRRNSLMEEIKSEIPSKLLELKFIRYLQENGVNEPSYNLIDEFTFVMSEASKRRNNFNDLEYLIGSDIALKLWERDFNITRYFKRIYKKDIYSLIVEKGIGKKMGKVLKK